MSCSRQLNIIPAELMKKVRWAVFVAFLAGGLLVCLTPDKAQSFCDELQAVDGHPAWIVGEVVCGNREARIAEDLKVIEV